MRTKFLLLVFSFLLTWKAYSQNVDVINKISLEPISDVAAFSLDHKKSGISNQAGVIALPEFLDEDYLIFQHAGFQEQIIQYKVLRDMGFLVKMVPSTVNLAEIVISANRWEQKRSDIPNKISKIEQKEIQFKNPQTSADLLGQSGEVYIQKSQLGGGSPMIRGFAANSILLVYDGIRMNNAIFRSGNLQNVILIDPNAIQSAEVIFGPGSVVYGSDALGGVMDFKSKDVLLSINGKLRVAGDVLLRSSTANGEKTGHVSVNVGGSKFGSFTSFTFGDFGNLKQGTQGNSYYEQPYYVNRVNRRDTVVANSNVNEQRPTQYDQKNFLQKFKYKLSDKLELGYEFLYSNSSNIPRYDRLIQLNKGAESAKDLKYAEWFYGPQNWMVHAVKLNLKDVSTLFDEMQTTLAYQSYEESRHKRKIHKTTLQSTLENVYAYSLNMDFKKRLNSKLNLFYGLESVYNKVTSKGSDKNILSGEKTIAESRYPDGGTDYLNLSLYSSVIYVLSPSFTLNTGLRYSATHLQTKFSNLSLFPEIPFDRIPSLKDIKLDNHALNGSFGVVYHPNKSTNIHMNAGSGYRAPNLDDAAKIFESVPGSIVVPNPGLKPEYAYNFDIGAIRSIHGKVRFNLDLFYTYLLDAMVRRPFTLDGKSQIEYEGELKNVLAIQNAGHANIYGASFGATWDVLTYLNLHSNITYTKGEDNEGIPLDHVSPLFGSTGVNLNLNRFRFDLSANYNGEVSYKNLSTDFRGGKSFLFPKDSEGKPYSPAWVTFDAKAMYQLLDNLQIVVGLENIGDVRYRPYASGISAPGRNFIISVRGTI